MSEEQDDLTLVYMYGFKNGELSMKAEIERLRAALSAYEIATRHTSYPPDHLIWQARRLLPSALSGEKTND